MEPIKNIKSNTSLLYTSNNIIMVDTSSTSITLDLPEEPFDTQTFIICDCAKSASTNNVIVNGNGNNINGKSSVVLDRSGIECVFVYKNNEWKAI